jgi:hypothetical protein
MSLLPMSVGRIVKLMPSDMTGGLCTMASGDVLFLGPMAEVKFVATGPCFTKLILTNDVDAKILRNPESGYLLLGTASGERNRGPP